MRYGGASYVRKVPLALGGEATTDTPLKSIQVHIAADEHSSARLPVSISGRSKKYRDRFLSSRSACSWRLWPLAAMRFREVLWLRSRRFRENRCSILIAVPYENRFLSSWRGATPVICCHSPETSSAMSLLKVDTPSDGDGICFAEHTNRCIRTSAVAAMTTSSN